MKIEMGESLFYSWLRHVKECQIVQTNWKASPQWELRSETELKTLLSAVDRYFLEKYNYKVFKKNTSLSQILRQGECDVVGVSIQDEGNIFYAVDVAFHESGLNYGGCKTTVMKVIAKTARTAMYLCGYMGCRKAEIIFASPKINPPILNDMELCMEELNAIFSEIGFAFTARIIANEDFNNAVLQPILMISDGIADTSELFLRSCQMLHMFAGKDYQNPVRTKTPVKETRAAHITDQEDNSVYKELKIGKIARVILRRILEEGRISEEEAVLLQQAEYSKKTFHIQYPVLVKMDSEYDAVRYYAHPLVIRGEEYLLCSQWFETSANNDRPYLIKWLEEHGAGE